MKQILNIFFLIKTVKIQLFHIKKLAYTEGNKPFIIFDIFNLIHKVIAN